MPALDGRSSRQDPAPLVSFRHTDGLLLELRPSEPADYRKVAEHLTGLSPEDLACRFLAPIRISEAVVHSFLERSDDKITFLALDAQQQAAGMATLVAARQPSHGEIGVSVSASYRRRGVATALLDHVLFVAADRDMAVVQVVTSAQNHGLQQLAARAGFSSVPYPQDRTLAVFQRRIRAARSEARR